MCGEVNQRKLVFFFIFQRLSSFSIITLQVHIVNLESLIFKMSFGRATPETS